MTFADDQKHFLGFDPEGKLVIAETEPFFGWEIIFVPKEGRKKYFDDLFAHVYQAGLPLFDSIAKAAGDYREIFKLCVQSPIVDALIDFEGAAAAQSLDFFGLEKFDAFLHGRIAALENQKRRFLDARDSFGDWRAVLCQLRHDMLLGVKIESAMIAGLERGSRKPVLKITADRRKFSLDWEANWNVIYNLDRHPTDWYGPLQGCLNLDVQAWKELAPVFRALALKVTDKRAAAFEHLKIVYPKDLPPREDIETDIRTLLDVYGMAEHPAMWTVSRKKGNKFALHICLSLAPEPDDREPVVVELDMRENAASALRPNWQGCREVAAARICEKYGFAPDGLAWDAEGKRVGLSNSEKYNKWLS